MSQNTAYPPEAESALRAFYGKFNANPSDEQKLNMLVDALGESHFYATDGEEVPLKVKVSCLEYEWLSIHDLIELDLA